MTVHQYTDSLKQFFVGTLSILGIQLIEVFKWSNAITFIIQTVIGILTIIYLTIQIVKKWKK